jgi:glycosyltransferase involved in cell wall biosynthesis
MNIAFFVSTLNYGGAEKQAVLDANMFSKAHNVFLFSFKKGPLVEILDSEVHLIQFQKSNYLLTAFKLIKIVKLYNIDIIHASLFAAMMTSALAGFLSKVKVFWHFHSHEYDISFRSRWCFTILSRCDCVIKILFVSHELEKYFKNNDFKFPANKCGILYNSATVYFKRTICEKPVNHQVSIGYVGRLVELKRVQYLIELAEYLNRNKFIIFQIIIVGDGPEKRYLQKMTMKKGLVDQVVFQGFQVDLLTFYECFDIFVLPSQEECLSLALIDASINGIPTVAFNVGGNAEIIEDGKSGFIVNSKDDLFKKTLILCQNEDLRIQFGKSAREICVNKFSQETRLHNLEMISNSPIKEYLSSHLL